MSRDTFTARLNRQFPATGTAGWPGGGGCPQPSCANCEALRFELAIMRADEELEQNLREQAERDRDEACARVAVLEEERKILVRERDKARDALQRLADCDWVITPHDRMDAVREIARVALAKMEAAK